MIRGRTTTNPKLWGEPEEAKAPNRKDPMTCSPLGYRFELFLALRSGTASLQAPSRHGPIAFASEGWPRSHRQSMDKTG